MNVALNDLTIVPINQTARVIRERLNTANAKAIFGDVLFPMAVKESAYPLLVTLAVSEDCLRVVLLALFADDNLSDGEATFIQPFLNSVAGLFAKCRADYKPYGSLSSSSSLKFLRKYREDKEPFGFECTNTSWSGLAICRRLAEVGGDGDAFENHANMLRTLAQAILRLDGVSTSEQKFLDRLESHLQAAAQGIGSPATTNRNSPTDGDSLGRDFAELQALLSNGVSAREWAQERYDRNVTEWQHSAEAGDARGQVLYGLCFLFGYRVEEDVEQAKIWFRKAAEQGNEAGRFYLIKSSLKEGYLAGLGAQEYEPQAMEWFRRSAERGDAEGQWNLGVCFMQGWGVEQDEAQAVEWFRKSAEQGYAAAQCDLGGCFMHGWGVEEDEGQAVEWFRRSAEQGYAPGQASLGECYFNGSGVDEDEAQAAEWYRKAAAQGDTFGHEGLEKCQAAMEASDQLSTESPPSTSGRLTKAIAKSFLRNPWSSDVQLFEYSSLDDDAAEILVEHGGPLCLRGLRDLSDSAAAILSRHSNYLELGGIEYLSDVAVKHLSANEGDLDLSGLISLSRLAAVSLGGHTGTLKLDGVKELSDSAAAGLAGHQGPVSLMGLKKISSAAARHLANHRWALALDDIEEFTEPLAAALSEGKAVSLSIQGLRQLSTDSAQRLARFPGALELMCSPQDLPDEVLSALAEHRGWLCFGEGPVALAPEKASILFRSHCGPLVLNGCSELADEVAKRAARHVGGLAFPNVCSVSDEVMKYLVDSDQNIEMGLDDDELTDSQSKMIARRRVLLRSANARTFVDDPSGGSRDEISDDEFKLADFSSPDGEIASLLNGFKSITPEAADVLARCGWFLDLSGLTELALSAAKKLANHKGSLCLDGLVNPGDDVIAALAEHRGYLSLNAITELSNRAASSLATHRGSLYLEGLALLSTKAAGALIAHDGALCFTHALLSEEIIEILSRHEHVEEELFDDSVVQNDENEVDDDDDEEEEEDDWSDDEDDE